MRILVAGGSGVLARSVVPLLLAAGAAPDLRYGDTVVPGAAVHAAFMAALDGSFATLADSSSLG
ncbi:hypothetical protein [Curtobacterium oceanosedimentum]|uniref:hypothetical protein n=1 Tax=Curtobacterium oceanosedimentum TaxID=465820 RepID=UPI001CE0EA62|nr:hypothetical protein [Curtobacterium oceanosedimentum]MCA5924916.1 hypothetical protein [Curtobacterium oceanosedimentum]